MSAELSMSEALAMDGAGAPMSLPNDGVTGGQLLRAAREAAGLHIAAVAVSLKVPVRKLEALEQDRYEELTDAVFIRALASSVCRTLKIDAQPILDRLPQSTTPHLLRYSDGINAPFRAPGDGAPPSWRAQLSRPVTITVLALLLGAVVILLFPRFQNDAAVTGSAVPAGAPPASPAAAGEGAPPLPMLISPAEQPLPAASAAVAPMAEAPVPGAAAAVSPASPASAAVDAALVLFRARQPSWVEVTDAKGGVGVRRLLAAGESANVSGAPPLQVTVGRVDAVDLEVRGKPFDLRAVSRDNVARFEIK